MDNRFEFKVYGRFALFTDPVTKLGGEKCSYHLPTYEALKGVTKSIYWKPTFVWIIDKARIVKALRTQSKGMKPLNYGAGGSGLSIYTYLADVEYQVQAHFEWNMFRPELASDRNDHKHFQIMRRMLERGGRQDIFLGTRECQGYVEPCDFGSGSGAYDSIDELSFGLMFHGFDYPDETGVNMFSARFFSPVMRRGIVEFPRPEACTIRKEIRAMYPKEFSLNNSVLGCENEEVAL